MGGGEHIVRMLEVFRDEAHTCLTLEYCDGGELFNLMGDGRMPEREVRRTHRQMLLGVRYLHHHNIGHRDISLENILLKDGNVRLADFGQAVQVHAVPRTEDPTSPAFRYFRLAGKDYYRAPEGYVFYRRSQAVCPDDYVNGSIVMVQVQVPAPAPTHRGHLALVSFTEAAVPGQVSPVETAGYAADQFDVFACGVCLFVLHSQKPPWKAAVLADDNFRFFFHDNISDARQCEAALRRLFLGWEIPLPSEDAMDLLSRLILPDPNARCTLQESLDHPWFA